MIYLPVKNSGMETKKPAMAQTLVEAAPFKYLLVLKNEKLFYDLQYIQERHGQKDFGNDT